MRSIAHVRICGGRGQATALGYPTRMGQAMFPHHGISGASRGFFHDRDHRGALRQETHTYYT
jgi:hypothetical protein